MKKSSTGSFKLPSFQFFKRTVLAQKLTFLSIALLTIVCGCSGGSNPPTPTTTNVTVFSDVHFNPMYDPAIFTSLMNASEDDWEAIFNTSSITTPQSWGHESNFPLLVKALEAIQTQSTGNPVIIFSGDILTHSFSSKFYALYDGTDEAALHSFIYKTVAFFAKEVHKYVGDIPVIFTIGNNDSYEEDYKLEPNSAFLADTANVLYTQLLLEGTDSATFLETYRYGGYYSITVGPVTFISLDTTFFSPRAASGSEVLATEQLLWLDQTLAAARTAGKSVWLVMHMPVGADIFSTVNNYMDDAGEISDAGAFWTAGYQSSFLDIINDYEDIIQISFAGHTHMDEYRLQINDATSSRGALVVTPAISPVFDNDSAFKVLTVDTTSWMPTNYRSIAYHFGDAAPAFGAYYTFASSYSTTESTLDLAMTFLFPHLDTDLSLHRAYAGYYYSGHNSANIISDVNWPAYWCGIGVMLKEDYIDCVNSQ